MREPNLELKAKIILKFGSIIEAARKCEIREDRLSRIIHRRVVPNALERGELAFQLGERISDLFEND
ncbi:MAG: hypothetical protein JRD05_13515 [Deltaproteobacteria bacterium]|nr:hypothetical protein [Deltaproteobacteria bacterium]